MVWVYYSTQIFLLGAEFTGVYAREHGSLAEAQTKSDQPDGSAKPVESRNPRAPRHRK
jgi:membrane protein